MAEQHAAPLTREVDLDAGQYRAALIDLIDLHEKAAGAAEQQAQRSDAAARRAGAAEEQAAQKAGQTWRQFISERLRGYQQMEGSHGAAMRRIAAEWNAYKAAGLAATAATERGMRGVGDEADRARRKLGEAADQFDRLQSKIGRGARAAGVAQDAMQVGSALRQGDVTGAMVGLGQLRESAQAAGLTTGRGLALGAGAAGVMAAGAALVKATANAASFEQSLVAIKRTAGLSDAELEELGRGLLDLSSKLGVPRDALAAIAEGAGSLGIPKDEMLQFTEVVARFSSATGLTADQSVDALGRISVAFREPIGNAERLGSVLDQLADETGATTQQIVMSLGRVGAVGASVGLTASQVAAFVAVMNEAGVDASDAGTSMRNALTIVQSEAEKVSKVMGTTKKEWLDAFGADPQQAILDLLAKLKQLEPTARAVALDDIFGRENATGITTLVSNLDRVQVALASQAQAYADGTRLQQSYEESTRTLSAQWAIFRETLGAWMTEAGGPVADTLAALFRAINSVTGATTDGERAYGEYTRTLGQQQELDRLIERHEALRAKTSLTAEEQAELGGIVKQIGQLIPSAVSRWDDLGGALDLHMEKVRQTAEEYRRLATEMQLKARSEALAEATEALDNRGRAQRLAGGTAGVGDILANPGHNTWDSFRRMLRGEAPSSSAERRTLEGQQLLAESSAALDRALTMLARMPGFLSGNDFQRMLPGASLNDYGRYVTMHRAGGAGPTSAPAEEEGTGTYTPPTRRRGPSAETLAERARREAEAAADADFAANQYQKLRGEGTRYAEMQGQVADALARATAAQTAYLAALDTAPDAVTVGRTGAAPDGAGVDVLRAQAEASRGAFEARARAAATYERALSAVEQAERAAHEAQQQRDRATAGSEKRRDLDALVAARQAEATAARAALDAAQQAMRIDERRAASLERLSRSPALGRMIEQFGGLDRLETDGLSLDMAERGRSMFERIEATGKLVTGARERWERAQGSGDTAAEQQAMDGYRAAVGHANETLRGLLSEFSTLDVPPKLAEWLSSLLRALDEDVPDSTRGMESVGERYRREGRDEAAAFAAQADIARQEQAVRLLERGAAAYDETAQLADAWADVGQALGLVPQRAAQAASAFAGVFRALSGVRQMQADIARIEAERSHLNEAARAARAAGDAAGAASATAQANGLSAPSGIAAMMPYAGLALAGVQVVSSLVSWGRQNTEENKALRRSLADAAASISRAVADARRAARMGSEMSQAEIDDVRGAVGRLRSGGLSQAEREAAYRTVYTSGVPGADRLQQQYDAMFGILKRGGMGTDDIRRILDDVLFGDGVDAKGFDWTKHLERMMGGPIERFGSWFDEWVGGLGQYSDSVAAALERLDFTSRYLGGTTTDALRAFVDALGQTEGLPAEVQELLSKAKALDVTTAEGRAQLMALVRPLMEAFAAGGLSLPTGSPLSEDDLLAILDALFGIASGQGDSGGGYSRQTQIAGTITEIQTNELLFYQAEQTRLLRSIESSLRLGTLALPPARTPSAYAAAASDGATSGGGVHLVINVKAEHRIEDITEEIARELRRSGLF